MAQNPLAASIFAQKPNGDLGVAQAGAAGDLSVTNNTLNVTAAAVIKAAPGRVAKISVLAPGSGSGTLTLNDCAEVDDATTENQVFNMAYNAAANVAGAVLTLDFPCETGIVVSAVPGAGSPRFAISWS